MGNVLVFASLHALATGLLDAQEASWLEMATGGHSSTEEAFALAQDRVVATLSDGDAGTLSGMALVRAATGDSRCELARCVGHGGAIAMSDAGTDGPFLAVYWNPDGAVWAACRKAETAPLQQLHIGEVDGDEIRMHYRGGVLYSYAAEPDGRVEPLAAVALDLGNEPLLGILSLGDFSCDLPRWGGLPPTLAHTFDLDLDQPGTELSPSWTAKEAKSSVNGHHLFHPPGEGDAFAEVTVRNLYEGSYDLWMSDQPSEEATGELQVHVGGATEESAFAISQRYGGGIWLGLGRHRFLQGASLSVDFRRAAGNAAPVSLDALHLLWSEWQDENQDTLPDALETGDSPLLRVTQGEGSRGTHPASGEGEPSGPSGPLTGISAVPHAKGLADGDRIVFYVDAHTGNDLHDGRAERVQAGPWHSSRTGPLRTIQKALDSIGDAAVVELYLSGPLEQPIGGFQTPNSASFILKAPRNGVMHITSGEAEASPALLPPPPHRPDISAK